MEESTVSIIISIVALLISLFTFYQSKIRSQTPVATAYNSVPLQLQAYERLVILSERLALPNLISRNYQPQFSSKEMQTVLVENIKQEFEYNASQQIYVSSVAWEAARNLREQNMLIINKVAATLPPDAKASDLNKELLEVLMKQKEKSLHTVVSEVINHEAKKIMK